MKSHITNLVWLLGAVVAAIPPAWSQEKGGSAGDLAARIEKLGGRVQRDETSPQKPVVGLHLQGPHVDDATLKQLPGFPQLRTLLLADNRVSDAGIRQ